MTDVTLAPAPAAAPTAPAAAPTPAAPPDPRGQRATLMADPEWRGKAMNPQSSEWADLMRLDEQIAQAPAAPAFIAESAQPPETVDGYDFLPVPGITMDEPDMQQLKADLHAAGVDADLAGVAYQLAALTEANEPTAEEFARQAEHAERTLLAKWGASYDERLAAANAEGKRLFEKLPASVRGDLTYREFMVAHGLANSVTLIEQLAARAAHLDARGPGHGAPAGR